MHDTYRMPFGRYRGQQIDALPDEYLAWLAALPDLRPRLRAAVDAEVTRRRPRADARRRSTTPDRSTCEAVITAGYRVLARQRHPDVGGSHEAMIAATAAADWLRSQLRGLPC